jgi:transcriptional regulator with XRE-family HTH domain
MEQQPGKRPPAGGPGPFRELGVVVEQLRVDRGLKRPALATKADIEPCELQEIEQGDVDADWGTLRKLAYALETPLEDLFKKLEGRRPSERPEARKKNV